MNAAEQHALGRSTRDLAVSIATAVAQRRERALDGRLAEREEQWQVAVNGAAGTTPAAAIVDIEFEQDFATATGNRMSQLKRPHFTCGFEVAAVSDATGKPSAMPPILTAVVTRWALDGLHITGATVALTAHSPAGLLTFRGVAHLSFQGYGVVTDSQPDQED